MSSGSSAVQFLGALSFEERCLGALSEAVNDDIRLDLHLYNYAQYATPGIEARAIREQNWHHAVDLMERTEGQISRSDLNPYSMGDMKRDLDERIDQSRPVVVDLTCFTRPHVLAIARWLALTENVRCSLRYTLPRSYGDLNASAHRTGWHDTLLLPLGSDPSLSNEGQAIGIVLFGHEVDRMMVALDEIEPTAGIALLATRQDRPDLHRKTFETNQLVIDHLASLFTPGVRAREIEQWFPTRGWAFHDLRFVDRVDLAKAINDEVGQAVDAARSVGAPAVFFPFGPKLLVFLIGYFMSSSYAEASWAVYPVARSHPLDYSDGVERVEHFDLSAVRQVQAR